MAKTSTQEKAQTQVPEEPKNNLPATQAQAGLPAEYDYGSDLGAGNDFKANEILLPFLRILQPLSPEVQEQAAARIEGAKPGMILNTATQEVYDGQKGLGFVAFAKDHNYAKFTPRVGGQKGGFHGVVPPDDPKILDLIEKHGQYVKLPNREPGKDGKDADFEYVEAFYFFGLMLNPEFPVPMISGLTFASSQIKKFKALGSAVSNFRIPINGKYEKVPLWAFKWRLKSVFEQNTQGSWFGWDIKPANETLLASLISPKDEIYLEAKRLWAEHRAGNVKADYEKSNANEADAGEGSGQQM